MSQRSKLVILEEERDRAERQRDVLLSLVEGIVEERQCDCGPDYQCEICHARIVIAKMKPDSLVAGPCNTCMAYLPNDVHCLFGRTVGPCDNYGREPTAVKGD